MQPRISILLPTYEPNERFLAIAIDSVLSQTFTDWELIIHDDRSKADVRAMVEKHLGDQRIRFERATCRLGIGGNWNACMKLARAPFVQFIFQDDMWEPKYLEKMSNILETDSSLGFVACDHAYLNDDGIAAASYDYVRKERAMLRNGKYKGRMFLYDWITRGLHPNLIGEPSFVMLRRSLVEKVGPFATDLQQSLDIDYWVRCLQHADFFWNPAELGAFRVHGLGASARNDAAGRGLFDRFLVLARLVDTLPEDEARHAQNVLHTQFRAMVGKFTRRMTVQASRASPHKRRSILPLLGFIARHPILMMSIAMGSMRK